MIELARNRRDTVLAGTNLCVLGADIAGILPTGLLFGLGVVTLLVGLYDFDLLDLSFGVDSSYLGWKGRAGMACYTVPIAFAFFNRTLGWDWVGAERIYLGGAFSFFFSILLFSRPPPPVRLTEGGRNPLEQQWHDILTNPDISRDDLILFWGVLRVPGYRLAAMARIATALAPYYGSLLILYLVIARLESQLILTVSLTLFIGLVALLREWGSKPGGEAQGLGRLEEVRGSLEGTLVTALTTPFGAAMLFPFFLLLFRALYEPALTAERLFTDLGSGTVNRFELSIFLNGMAYWLGGLLVPLFYMVGLFRTLAGKLESTVGWPFLHLLGSAVIVHFRWPSLLPWSLSERLLAMWPSFLLLWFITPTFILGIAVFTSFWLHRWIGVRTEAKVSLGVALIAFLAFVVYRNDPIGVLPSGLPGVALLLAVTTLLAGGMWIANQMRDLATEAVESWDDEDAEEKGWIVEALLLLLFGGYIIAHGIRYLRGYTLFVTLEAIIVGIGFLFVLTLMVLRRFEEKRRNQLTWLFFGMKEEAGEVGPYREAYAHLYKFGTEET